jgi:hypothetical protein
MSWSTAERSISCWYGILKGPPTHFLPMFHKFVINCLLHDHQSGPVSCWHLTECSVFWTGFSRRVGAFVLEHSVMALPLCFVPSYLNVLERILLDEDFTTSPAAESICITCFRWKVAQEAREIMRFWELQKQGTLLLFSEHTRNDPS